MFLKTSELKKNMKNSLKSSGLTVGNVCGHYLVYASGWGVYVEHIRASNKFKAALIELIGDLPDYGECWRYAKGDNGELEAERIIDFPDPYEEWIKARDSGMIVPLTLHMWPHTYNVIQRKSDHRLITVASNYLEDVISERELENEERMPGSPSILDGQILYFKNDAMTYWARAESLRGKVLEILLPLLEEIDFFTKDWKLVDSEEDDGAGEDGTVDEQLPY